MQIAPIPARPSAAAPAATPTAAPVSGASFKEVLLDHLQQVQALAHDAEQTLPSAGPAESTAAEVLSASRKADLAYAMLRDIHDQLQQAYDDLQKFQP